MSKKSKLGPNQKLTKAAEFQPDLTQEVMNKVASGEIKMKPHWYFLLGSVLGVASLLVISLLSIFLVNIMFFSLRQHGPMSSWRLQQLFATFPWWTLPLALIGVLSSVWLLKRYEFSYKRNFVAIILVFISVLILAAILIDQLGLNEIWSKRGMMKRFYQRNQSEQTDQQTIPRKHLRRNFR